MDGSDGNWYHFADFRLNVAEKVLRRDGEIIPLPSKVLEVLCLLVARAGTVVSKQQLMDAVWPDSFVEESNLTQSIYALRKALGQAEAGKPMIETVPKRGYRLAVPVDAPKEILFQSPSEQAGKVAPKHGRLWLGAVAAVAVALISSAFFAVRYGRGTRTPPVDSVKFQRLTFSGDISFPILSPDGRSLAYVRENAVHLQDVASGSSIRLKVDGHEKFGNLQFSVEGESIYFRNEDSFDASGDLFQVSRFGGQAKLVTQKVWSTVGFSPDGAMMAFVRFFPTRGEWAVIVRDVASGDERTLISRNLPYTIFRIGFPAWSSDGKQIAVVEQTPEQQNISRLVLVDSVTGDVQAMATPNLVQIEQVAWLPENSGLMITGRENNRFFQLWKMDLPGGELHRVTNDLNNYRTLSVSSDGKSMIARQFSVFSHIWTAPADDIQTQRQITYGNLNRDGGSGLAWTPDGRIIYATRITGNIDLWALRPEDGVRQQLTENAGTNNENPFVTADGSYVFFESTRSGKRRIWRIGIDGSDPVQVSPDDDNTDFLPVVSPDGSTLYYIQRNPRSNVLWRQRLADGSREMLTQQGKIAPGSFLAISPDGRYLAFKNQKEQSDTDTAELVFFDLAGKQDPQFVTIHTQNPTIVFSDGGRSFDYVDNQPDAARLWRQPFGQPGQKRLLLELPRARIFGFEWSRDGQTLAMGRGRQDNDIILLSGF